MDGLRRRQRLVFSGFTKAEVFVAFIIVNFIIVNLSEISLNGCVLFFPVILPM